MLKLKLLGLYFVVLGIKPITSINLQPQHPFTTLKLKNI